MNDASATRNGLPTLIISAVFLAANPASAKPDFSKEQTEAISDGFADCVVKAHPRQARELVGRHLPEGRYSSLVDGDCLVKASKAASGVKMTFPAPHFRYALARALVRSDYAASPIADFNAVPALVHEPVPPFVEADLPKNKRKADDIRLRYASFAQANAMDRFGECVVRASPGAAKALIVSKPNTVERAAAVGTVKPFLSGCLAQGTVKLNAYNLTGALAVSYFRLAYQAQPAVKEVAQTGAKP